MVLGRESHRDHATPYSQRIQVAFGSRTDPDANSIATQIKHHYIQSTSGTLLSPDTNVLPLRTHQHHRLHSLHHVRLLLRLLRASSFLNYTREFLGAHRAHIRRLAQVLATLAVPCIAQAGYTQ